MPISPEQLRLYHEEGKTKIVLSHLRNRVKMKSVSDYRYKQLYVEILKDTGKLKQAHKEIFILLKKRRINFFGKMTLKLELAEIYLLWGEINKFMELLKEIRELLPNIKNPELHSLQNKILLLQAYHHYLKGDFGTSLNLVRQLDKRNPDNNSFKQLVYLQTVKIYREQGNIEKALEYIKKITSMKQKKTIQHLLLIEIAKIQLDMNNFSIARQILKKLEIKTWENPILYALIQMQLGIINKKTGKFNEALAFFSKSQELFESQNYRVGLFTLYNLIGDTHFQIGNIASALDYFQKALVMAIRFDKKEEKATTIVNIAKVIQLQGNNQTAKTYLTNAIDLLKNGNFPKIKAKILFYLGIIALEGKNNNEFTRLKNQVIEIQKQTKIPAIGHYVAYLDALDHFYKSRFIDKELAKQNFHLLTFSENVDSEIQIGAAIKLAHLLVLELKISGDPQLVDEIKQVSETIRQIAERENSLLLKTILSILNARLAILNYDLKKAKEILDNLKSYIDKTDSRYLKRLVQYQEKEINEEIMKWHEAFTSHPNLISQIEKAKVIDYINDISWILKLGK